jgi:biotin transport system substrate-specific component
MKDTRTETMSSIAAEQALAARREIAKYAAFSALFTVAMVAAAHVRIPLPFTPVPVTLQTFVVLVAGLCLGSMWGGLSQAQYIGLGLLGAPAFAGGVAAFVGPTGGYLVGMVIAAVLTGAIYARYRTTWGALAACLAGHAAIFAFGCMWLVALSGEGIAAALAIGLVPFIPGMVLKTAAAVALVRAPYTGSTIRKVFSH